MKQLKLCQNFWSTKFLQFRFFGLFIDFSRPPQFYAQRYYHFKQIFNKIEDFKQGNCKWKMKCVLPAVLISSQLACKSKGSNDKYLERNPISKLA